MQIPLDVYHAARQTTERNQAMCERRWATLLVSSEVRVEFLGEHVLPSIGWPTPEGDEHDGVIRTYFQPAETKLPVLFGYYRIQKTGEDRAKAFSNLLLMARQPWNLRRLVGEPMVSLLVWSSPYIEPDKSSFGSNHGV